MELVEEQEEMDKESLRVWRVRRRLTQKELARLADVSQEYISHVENQYQINYSQKTMSNIATALGISPQQIEEFHDYLNK